MAIRKVPHKKPNDNDRATIHIVGANRIDIVARRNGNSNISKIQTLNGSEMINIITGEIKQKKKKQYKDKRTIENQMVVGDRVVSANFKGRICEKLLETHFSIEMPEFAEAVDLFGDFMDRLQRRYGKIDYVRITMFEGENQPFFQVWCISKDKKELNITDTELDKIWGNGKAKVIEITPSNIEKLIKFDWRDKTITHIYPTGIQIISKSKGIRNVEIIEDDYVNGVKRTKGFKTKYKSTKEIYTLDKTGKEKVVQSITFESYERIKRTIKLNLVAGHKHYKGKKKIAEIIKSKEDKAAITHKVKVKSKPIRVVEKENNILFAEIGQEVQERINKNRKEDKNV